MALGASWRLFGPHVGLLGPLGGLFGASWGLLAASVGLLVGLEAEKWPWLEREQDLLGFLGNKHTHMGMREFGRATSGTHYGGPPPKAFS